MPTSRRSGRVPKWPTLEEQLRAAGAIHGSKLEQMITDNQAFDLLQPEEANDDLGIPPWLRVHWRKLHPDADYSGPSGGYPHTLHDLGEWMETHQDFVGDAAEREVPPDRPDPRSPAEGRNRG
jgi:hypothetical protein